MRQITVAAAIAALTLTGCGTMLPGTIYSEQGKVLQFQIEMARRTGAVTAFDPSTGEQFAGTYVGVREGAVASSSAFVSAGGATGNAFGSTAVMSNMANATALLTGDKGSTLTCQMRIEAGLSPHGIGTCRDNRGVNYRVQF